MTFATPQDTLLSELDSDLDPLMMDSELIETTDEEGNVHLFEKIDEYELDKQRYALLVYAGEKEGSLLGGHQHTDACSHGKGGAGKGDSDDDEEEVVVMRIIADEDGTEVFEAIEDDAEFEKIVAHIDSLSDEEFDGDDEE
ncbi:MAG: DUF1292 domain-containing protein [Vampirovibrionales bacterium]|nr:DUF1292 domain-containing protein [Vampirovibrionales bacterium]